MSVCKNSNNLTCYSVVAVVELRVSKNENTIAKVVTTRAMATTGLIFFFAADHPNISINMSPFYMRGGFMPSFNSEPSHVLTKHTTDL